MNTTVERRLLQIIVAAACVVPLTAGTLGVVRGVDWLHGTGTDLDSHFRYLSGIFLGVGIAFASCVPAIERRGARFSLLGAFVVCGGLARLLSLTTVGVPGTGQVFGLVMELGVVPCLLAWQASFARRYGSGTRSR